MCGGSFSTSAVDKKYRKVVRPAPENNETTPFVMCCSRRSAAVFFFLRLSQWWRFFCDSTFRVLTISLTFGSGPFKSEPQARQNWTFACASVPQCGHYIIVETSLGNFWFPL